MEWVLLSGVSCPFLAPRSTVELPRSTVMTDPLVMRQYRTTQPLPWGDRPRHLRTQPYVPVCRYRTPFLTRPDPS